MMRPPSLATLAAAALLVAAASVSAAQDAPPQLPPGVVARVYGEEVTELQLLDRLARRYEATEKGRGILEQIVDDRLVEAEARRRNVTVSDDEARGYVEKMAEVVRMQSGGKKTLDEALAETKTTREEFVRTAKDYLARERMAREDLGMKEGEEVPEHRMKLWASALRRKAAVRYEGLPEGVLAQIGADGPDAVRIDRTRFAEELRTRLPPEEVASLRVQLALEIAARHYVRQQGIVVDEADVDRELARARAAFASDPRFRDAGLTFDEYLLRARGLSEREYRNDPALRTQVGVRKLLNRDLTDDQVRRHWEQNRLAYGDRALVRQVYVAAAESGGTWKEGLPTFREASDLALRAKVAILERAGMLKGGAPRPGAPSVGEIVTAVAKEFTADAEKRKEAGEPVAWTRQSVAGEPKLEEVVFDGAVGQLVGPIRSTVGYHVLYVEERRPAPTWDEVRDHVREDLLRLSDRQFWLMLRTNENVVIAK